LDFFRELHQQLDFLGEFRDRCAELASRMKKRLGFDVRYSPEEPQKMDNNLNAKLTAKQKPSSQPH
jgi:hypothetical protein